MNVFPPTIDISDYTDDQGNFTLEGEKELKEFTKNQYEVLSQNRKNDEISHGKTVKEIEDILRSKNEKDYQKIEEIIDSYEYRKIKKIFEDLNDFQFSYAVYVTEKGLGINNTIYDLINSLKDYCDNKLLAVFLFRRIMLLCLQEEIEDAFERLYQRNVSYVFIIQILKECREIGNRGYIAAQLSKLFMHKGMNKESAIMMDYAQKEFGDRDTITKYPDVPDNVYVSKKNIKCCFITCVNDELSYDECLFYINRQIIPDNYEIDTIAIREADGMCAGYNAAMKESVADIKVYLHQDVCILKPFFVLELVRIFESDKSIGMVGMVGSIKLPPDAVMWHGMRYGKLYADGMELTYGMPAMDDEYLYYYVEAVDGLLIATNRDIPWREDLFDRWHFYDASQSAEFRKKGYKVVVPDQSSPWVAHDDGLLNLKDYDKYRNIFIKEYFH